MSADNFQLGEAVALFMRSREAMGCTAATLRTYRIELAWICRALGSEAANILTTAAAERVLAERRAQVKPISAHRTYRTLRTFCNWCVRTNRLPADPMVDIRMCVPKVLPRVPSDDEVRALLAACPATFEGRRNRLLVALATDSGLRKEELRLLRIADLDQATRQIRVVAGKGQRDRVGFFGDGAASILRAWLAVHPDPRPSAFLFVTQSGQLLGPWAFARILYRLSARAGLPRKISPHALRHYTATAVLRRTGDLELVRRVLGHATLAMALRYVALADTEFAARYHAASPLDNLSVTPRRVR